ncbi:hypothetical protein BC831DRAFT_470986 [Entophlyctis helioformis]|nr:hypothetical protein BC831DRAFT_470986 [Entophlyctis helioformis]
MDYSDLKERLLFAVPKKGRLNEKCLKILEGADIQFSRMHRLDIARSTNLPIALVFLPAGDIAKFVADGNVDIGITGQDMVAENGADVTELLPLGFGKCKLSLLVPEDGPITHIDQLIGKRIATSFEHIVTKYFSAREAGLDHDTTLEKLQNAPKDAVFATPRTTSINYIGGSVETSCALGLADAIVDLVESGDTMRAAKLKPIATLWTSQAVLISNPKKQQNRELVEKIRRRIQGVIDAERYVLCNYNIRRTSLAAGVKITPGKKAPSVSPLEDADWVMVSSMVPKSQISDVMDQLLDIGAEDVLVFDIHNCQVAA